MKQTIRLNESQLRKIIRESVKNILKEESYRKAAKKGNHTSTLNKQNLKYWKKNYGINCNDFHKYADKHGLDKMAPGAEAIFQWEGGLDKNNNYVGGGMQRKFDKFADGLNESSLNGIIKKQLKGVLKENIQDDIDNEIYESLWVWIRQTISKYSPNYNEADLKDLIAFNLQAAMEDMDINGNQINESDNTEEDTSSMEYPLGGSEEDPRYEKYEEKIIELVGEDRYNQITQDYIQKSHAKRNEKLYRAVEECFCEDGKKHTFEDGDAVYDWHYIGFGAEKVNTTKHGWFAYVAVNPYKGEFLNPYQLMQYNNMTKEKAYNFIKNSVTEYIQTIDRMSTETLSLKTLYEIYNNLINNNGNINQPS